ncbi:chitin synthase chs-2-like [Gigantopelta aegis]|uniref:chitin synthase chs-2-like n=1 Tax=Gigantopelta aegis TaxID=1735272 RepID=UPI001B889FCC|nr:chitin synthase chs-2-like [Gigantopelta aegis]
MSTKGTQAPQASALPNGLDPDLKMPRKRKPVKNKKRWSQVMYMSYVLDFLTRNPITKDEECFVLTTDADVDFTPESVATQLDLMTRDSTVGAVCARTHPMGNGPLVWYQTFEYAIGHWFQKAAEHVLGSVLCALGCFSVYRCRAIKEILHIYATSVEHASDFLTRDMGEDRWLCTLMVQSGWRIEYCAVSENKPNCPREFEEFYKQRRRWIASTIANLMLILQEWRVITRVNQGISVLFILNQALLLFSTLISPGTVILVVAGTREKKIESSITKEPWQRQVKFWFKKIFLDKFSDTSGSSESEDSGSSEVEDDIALLFSVEDWLPDELKCGRDLDKFGSYSVIHGFRQYAQSFRYHGFDNTMFISGMNEKELKDIGIKTETHKQFILDQIELLPAFEIEYHVPVSIKE